MNEEKDGMQSEELVSDAPTIVGKSAQDIREGVNSALSGEDAKTETDANDQTSPESENVLEDNTDVSENTPNEETKTDGEVGSENTSESEDDIDDFSELEVSDDSRSAEIDITGDDSGEPLTSSNVKEDPSLNKALEIISKKKDQFLEVLSKIRKALIIAAIVLASLFLIAYIACIATRPTDKVAKNIWIGDLYVGDLSYEETLASIEASDLMSNQEIRLKCGNNYRTFNGSEVGSSANAEETARLAFDYGKSGNILKDGFAQMRSYLGKYTIAPPAALDRDRLATILQDFGTEVYGELVQHSLEFTDTSAIVTPGHTGFDMDISTALDEVEQSVARGMFNPIEVSLKSAPPYDFTIETFDNICYKDPVDAYYKVEGNTVEIVPEETGRYINKEEAEPFLPLIKEGGEQITVPIYLSYAEITEAALREKLFANTLGSYSTNYGGSSGNRKANVARAAELINGTVVAPGAVFSFNDTVGHRTKANGFYTAKEYVNGQSVDGIGGGTCQVSTTLYSAVLYADLGIVYRENHMMTVGYVPLGQDATVADGSVDFKFQNTTDAPIKIVTTANGSTITVSIVGTAWSPERTVKLSHSTSSAGENTVVTSYRYVYSNGELISTDRLGTSVYQPHKPQPQNNN